MRTYLNAQSAPLALIGFDYNPVHGFLLYTAENFFLSMTEIVDLAYKTV